MFGNDPGMAGPRNVIIEFYRVGAYVKVSAIDPRTMTEVCIVGDPAAGEAALKRAAMRKLRYVLERDDPRPSPARRQSVR